MIVNYLNYKGEKMVKTLVKERNIEYSRLLEGVLQGITDIIGVYDTSLNIIFYNQAGYDFFQVKPQDIIGKKCYEMLGRRKKCDICITGKAIKTKKLQKIEKYIPELEMYMECSANPVLDNEGNVELVIEQLHDITEQRKGLARAAKIQKQRLEFEFPLPQNAQLETVYQAAEIVSGDFFHFYQVNDHAVLGILGDVSGKGVGAALTSSMLKVLFLEYVKTSQEPLAILRHLNKELKKYILEEFVAVVCFYFDFKTTKLHIAGGGINNFIYLGKNGSLLEESIKGPPLCMIDHDLFEKKVLDFSEGDRFYFTSDGLEELDLDMEFMEGWEKLSLLEQKQKLQLALAQEDKLADDVTWLAFEII